MTLVRTRAIACACAIAVLVACDQSSPTSLRPRLPVGSATSTKTRIIGLVGTMSGPDAWRGEDAFEGAHLAISVLNRSLKANEPAFELVTHDDGGDPGTATQLVEEIAGNDRTVGVAYAGPVEGLPPAESALAAAGIPALLTNGDLYSARLLSPHVFQVAPAYLWQARVIARYLLRDRRYRRIGILSEDSLQGETARRSMTTALGELGGRLSASGLLSDDPSRVKSAIRPLYRASVQAIVVQGSPRQLEQVLKAQVDRSYESTRLARNGPSAGPGADGDYWGPQIVGFDAVIGPSLDPKVLEPGLVAADTYARGAHYLPVPSFESFHEAFVDWWDAEPLGWERRSYEAVGTIGWAARRVPTGKRTDVASVLERLRGRRFGGLDVTFGPDDHTAAEQTTVGLWVVPRPGTNVREKRKLPELLPWVPLARAFSIDGERTDVLPQDWRWLFRNAPPKNRPAPKVGRSLYGVTTGKKDPVH